MNITCYRKLQTLFCHLIACQHGFIRPNGTSCVPCGENRFGRQCLQNCSCSIFQRCDHVHGCVNITIITEPIQTTVAEFVSGTELVWNTVKGNLTTYITFSTVNPRIQNITPLKESTGLLQREIVIYSSVIAAILLALGLTSLVRKYRKKSKGKVTKHGSRNVKQSNSLRQMRSNVDSPSSLYDEIDETKLVENAGIRTPQIKHIANDQSKLRDINKSGYIFPIHSEGSSTSFHGSEKHVNISDLTLLDSDQNQNSDEFDKDYDASGYLHPYHSIDEDWKEKTHQYDVTHAPSIEVDDSSDSSTQMITDGYLHPYNSIDEDWKEKTHQYDVTHAPSIEVDDSSDSSTQMITDGYLHPYNSIDENRKEKTHQYDVTHAPSIEVDDSSDSSTQMITDGYLNPYQPLDEDWKQTSHSYEVPVTIHQCQGHSMSSLLPKEGLKGDIKEDRIDNNLQNTVNVLHQNQSLSNGNSQTSVNPKQIANAVNNNKDSLLMPSKIKSTETAVSSENNIEHSNESVSRKEHALDQEGVSDLRKTENVPINCNSLEVQNVIVNASILNGTNIYVQDYTDAKSQ
ncbi:unnamed protein product [Mytilus edulis]|uniref:MEGF10_11 n=1 Tax=Mytilus edulis TaxID=6550 RepID=A0A8S3RTI4_MYTED|nr:unnamed protein product [Mytilus edulis]